MWIAACYSVTPNPYLMDYERANCNSTADVYPGEANPTSSLFACLPAVGSGSVKIRVFGKSCFFGFSALAFTLSTSVLLSGCGGGSGSSGSGGSGSGGGGGTTTPTPAITSISPAKVPAGATATTLTINGSGFSAPAAFKSAAPPKPARTSAGHNSPRRFLRLC